MGKQKLSLLLGLHKLCKPTYYSACLLAIAILFTLTSCSSKVLNNESEVKASNKNVISDEGKVLDSSNGSTIGNIINGGYVAKKDDWIFGTLKSYCISKTNTTNSDKYIELTNDDSGNAASNIYIVGNHIYFRKYDSPFCFDGQTAGYIYRIKTDGKQEARIIDTSVLFFYIQQNNIFYCDVDRDESGAITKYRIQSVDLHGEYKKVLFEEPVKRDFTSLRFIVKDNNLYFFRRGDSLKLCIYDYEKGAMVKTINSLKEKGINQIGDFVLDNQYIYFTEMKESNGYANVENLHRLSLHDGSIRLLVNGNVPSFNVDKDWIYFNWDKDKDFNNMIYKMNKDGTSITKLCEIDGRNLNIIDGWLFCNGGGRDRPINFYKVKTDGSGNIKIRG